VSRPAVVLADPDANPPLYPWRGAPGHLATRAQLREMGLRPGRQGVQALLLWPSRRGGRPRVDGLRFAELFDTRLARPRLTVSERHAAAAAAALAARMTCRACGVNRGYVPSRRLGMCNVCAAAAGDL
jgi:ribosomal protein S14